VISNNRAAVIRPAAGRRAEQVAVGVGDQAGRRIGAIGFVEDGQRRQILREGLGAGERAGKKKAAITGSRRM
jgi:hypothetical protein